jgi:hypothetical protein
LKNSFLAPVHNFAGPWSRQFKTDVGDQSVRRKICRKAPHSIQDGLERGKSLFINFGGIFEVSNFRSFSTESADCGRRGVSQNPADFSPKTGEQNC